MDPTFYTSCTCFVNDDGGGQTGSSALTSIEGYSEDEELKEGTNKQQQRLRVLFLFGTIYFHSRSRFTFDCVGGFVFQSLQDNLYLFIKAKNNGYSNNINSIDLNPPTHHL